VRRHAAAFDIPEWEGGGVPPHSKAPSAHQTKEISGEPAFGEEDAANLPVFERLAQPRESRRIPCSGTRKMVESGWAARSKTAGSVSRNNGCKSLGSIFDIARTGFQSYGCWRQLVHHVESFQFGEGARENASRPRGGSGGYVPRRRDHQLLFLASGSVIPESPLLCRPVLRCGRACRRKGYGVRQSAP
jgi:hypothetical protein